jgi:predicted aspartyl protease
MPREGGKPGLLLLLLALLGLGGLALFLREPGEASPEPEGREKAYLQEGYRVELVPLLGSRAPGRDSRIFGVPVEFPGFSRVFSWDTGATEKTLISSRLARELGLELLPPEATGWRDAGGRQILLGEARLSFQLFNDAYREHPVGVYREEVFPEIDGFLGTDILLRYQWTLDAERGILVVRAPGSLPGEALAAIPVTVEEGAVFLPGKINGRGVSFLLDTGLSDTTLPPGIVEELGIDRRELDFETPNLGGLDYALADLQLGGVPFPDSFLFLMEQPMRAYPMLGQSVLNRMAYTLDPELRVFVIHEKR